MTVIIVETSQLDNRVVLTDDEWDALCDAMDAYCENTMEMVHDEFPKDVSDEETDIVFGIRWKTLQSAWTKLK